MLEKAFEKQTKTTKYQWDKQVESVKKHGKQLAWYNALIEKYDYDTEKDIPSFKKNEIISERYDKILKLSKKVFD